MSDELGLILAQPVRSIVLSATAVNLSALPLAETEYEGFRYRALVDLTIARQVRLIVNTSGNGQSGSVMRLKWCATENGTYAEFQATNQPTVPVHAIGLHDSGWIDVPSAARAEVFVYVAVAGGTGSGGPIIGRIEMQLR